MSHDTDSSSEKFIKRVKRLVFMVCVSLGFIVQYTLLICVCYNGKDACVINFRTSMFHVTILKRIGNINDYH